MSSSPRDLGRYALCRSRPKDEDEDSEDSMEMVNDPRFTTPTVLDKRLFAFTAQVGFVGGLTSSASLSQCFKLKKHLMFGYCNWVPTYKIVQSLLQLLSFFGMSVVLCLSLYSTLVSVNQAYFGNRLLTAGSNGFELAKSFYMDRHMVSLRHNAVKFLARALILLLLSAGGMLYVKFSEDQDVEAGYESYDEEARAAGTRLTNHTAGTGLTLSKTRSGLCDTHVHPAGLGVMIMFSFMSFYLYRYIQRPHEDLFKKIYAMRYQHEDSFGGLLNQREDEKRRKSSQMASMEEETVPEANKRGSSRQRSQAEECVCM